VYTNASIGYLLLVLLVEMTTCYGANVTMYRMVGLIFKKASMIQSIDTMFFWIFCMDITNHIMDTIQGPNFLDHIFFLSYSKVDVYNRIGEQIGAIFFALVVE